MVTVAALSEDSQVITVLCTGLGVVAEGVSPLNLEEWAELQPRIVDSSYRTPGALLGRRPEDLRAALRLEPEEAQRLFALLEGAAQLAQELERLQRRGVWVLTRADAGYPASLADRLGAAAPPVLFGIGPIDLVREGGLAVLGVSELDEQGEAFASELGRQCAASHLPIVSTGERGVDRSAMLEVLEAGGTAIGVVADSLQRHVRLRTFRQFVADGRLVFLTPHLPSGAFDVGRAETRNRIIYGLARHAVVVSSGDGSGATWTGAVENLERGWVPLFVRSGPDAPAGNRALCQRDAIPINHGDLPAGVDLAEWFNAVAEETLAQRVAASAGDAFDQLLSEPVEPTPVVKSAPAAARSADPCDLFELVWPRVADFLGEGKGEKEVAEAFGLVSSQARAWLQRAVAEERARKLTRPVRYVRQEA